MQVVNQPTNQTALPGVEAGLSLAPDYAAICDPMYPGLDQFNNDLGYRDYLQAVAALRMRGRSKSLSLYLRVPPLGAAGQRGGCGNVVPIGVGKAALYLAYLKREIELQGRLLNGMNRVERLHLGGATHCLDEHQLEELMLHLHRWFRLAPAEAGEYAIDIDPSQAGTEVLCGLRRQGFNRLGLVVPMGEAGPGQGERGGRPASILESFIEAARAAGFQSARVELDYGASPRRPACEVEVLSAAIRAKPERIGIACRVHAPQHGQCDQAGDAAGDLCVRSGYVHVGLDQYALPADEWITAQAQGRLHHNLHGYSTRADMSLIAFGAGAISSVGAFYCQNAGDFDTYCDLLDRNELPVGRGMRLGIDEILRRTIVEMLVCQFEMSIPVIEQAFSISFAGYFQRECQLLAGLERRGLVALEPEWLTITAPGRMAIREVCMVFAAGKR